MRGSTILVPYTSESPEGQGLSLLPWLEPEHTVDEGLVPVWRAGGRAASAPASDICKQFSGALRRCFPPAAWQPDAAQKLAGSLEASLSPALRCRAPSCPGRRRRTRCGGQSGVGAQQDPSEGLCWRAGLSKGGSWPVLTLGLHKTGFSPGNLPFGTSCVLAPGPCFSGFVFLECECARGGDQPMGAPAPVQTQRR